jgi:NAD(P)-dependent dehydrogenase (short-subunit alcohol dehydrogenase family)
MQKTVHQKTIVITGASAGVGRAAALRFARAGANLALIARDAHALNDLKSEVEAIGARAIVLPVDVADADAVFKAADIVAKSLGSIDVWINNAMVTVFSPVWLITPGEFRRVTEVTYFGVVNGTMAALRHMRPRTTALSSMSGPRLLTGQFRCKRPIAVPSTRSAALLIHCVPN